MQHVDVTNLYICIEVFKSALILVDHPSHAFAGIFLVDFDSLVIVLGLFSQDILLVFLKLFGHTHLVSHEVSIDLRLFHQVLESLALQQGFLFLLLPLFHLFVELLFLSLDVCKLLVALFPECKHVLGQLFRSDDAFLSQSLGSDSLLANLLQHVGCKLLRV